MVVLSIGWFRQDLEVDFPRETAEGLAHREQVLEVVSGGISGFFLVKLSGIAVARSGPKPTSPTQPVPTNSVKVVVSTDVWTSFFTPIPGEMIQFDEHFIQMD